MSDVEKLAIEQSAQRPVVLGDSLVLGALNIGLVLLSDLGQYEWRLKGHPSGVRISFCAGLIQSAGGIEKFLAEWERVPWGV